MHKNNVVVPPGYSDLVVTISATSKFSCLFVLYVCKSAIFYDYILAVNEDKGSDVEWIDFLTVAPG